MVRKQTSNNILIQTMLYTLDRLQIANRHFLEHDELDDIVNVTIKFWTQANNKMMLNMNANATMGIETSMKDFFVTENWNFH